jgi:cell wall assembly regulator SMI1
MASPKQDQEWGDVILELTIDTYDMEASEAAEILRRFANDLDSWEWVFPEEGWWLMDLNGSKVGKARLKKRT